MAFELPSIFLWLAIPSLFLSAIQQILQWNKSRTSKPQFPGPQQFPVVGRVHDLPRFSMWKKFKEWADIHGPIYQTSMGGQTFVIISDEKIAEELLIKRGHIYSGRPQIRALVNHKQGIGYLALMDRTGVSFFFLIRDQLHGNFRGRCVASKLYIRLTSRQQQTTGPSSASGSTRPWRRHTEATFMDTSRPRLSGT